MQWLFRVSTKKKQTSTREDWIVYNNYQFFRTVCASRYNLHQSLTLYEGIFWLLTELISCFTAL